MGVNGARARVIAYKCMLYGVAMLLVGILQVSFFSRVNILGATPDMLLGMICALALLEDREVCAVCGIVGGVVYCSLGGFSYPLYIAFSFLCGYFLPPLSSRVLGRGYLSYLALAVITFAAKGAYNMLETLISSYSADLLHIFFGFALPEYLSSLALCSLSYLAVRWLGRVFSKAKASNGTNRKEDRK